MYANTNARQPSCSSCWCGGGQKRLAAEIDGIPYKHLPLIFADVNMLLH
uniref:Uncharacterized protein n=1 Tax=Zea mays TaxID=4577 RepID=C0HI67_MAIZE|nr:unknown [Zea mays]